MFLNPIIYFYNLIERKEYSIKQVNEKSYYKCFYFADPTAGYICK